MQRQLLVRVVQCLVIIPIVLFAYIFFTGLASKSSQNKKPDDAQDLKLSIAEGETQFIKLNKQRHWITHLSKKQKTQLQSLAPFVYPLKPNAIGPCSLSASLCPIKMATDQTGIELRYSEKAPGFLKPDIPWYGGFVNPSNQAVYDLIGRGYRINIETSKKNLFKH